MQSFFLRRQVRPAAVPDCVRLQSKLVTRCALFRESPNENRPGHATEGPFEDRAG